MNSPAPPLQHRRPLWFAAFVTGLLVPSTYLLAVSGAILLSGESLTGESAFRGFGVFIMFVFPVCMVAAFVLGLPIALVLRARGALTALNVCVTAVFIGTLAFIAVGIAVGFGGIPVIAYLWGPLTGFMAGAIFSWVAGIRWGRAAA